MNEPVAYPKQAPTLDPEGSLVDARVGAYLTWVDQQRLPGAAQSSFLVWREDHPEAVAISPTFPRGTESNSPLDLHQALSQLS
jgi:hypothetical protein